jgi:pyruvate carboxylase subunit B
MPRESYHVETGHRTLRFEWDGRTLYQDGRPVSATLRQVGEGRYSVLVEGQSLSLSLEGRSNGTLRLRTRDGLRSLTVRDRRALVLRELGMENGRRSGEAALLAPMPGLIVQVLVSPGDRVGAGDSLAVLEAMKMENELRAVEDAVIGAVHVQAGTAVGKGQVLIEFGDRHAP